jgi:hypothetical protein
MGGRRVNAPTAAEKAAFCRDNRHCWRPLAITTVHVRAEKRIRSPRVPLTIQ